MSKTTYSMVCVTADMWLDELLTSICNSVDAKRPVSRPAWEVKTAGIQGNSLELERAWGGTLLRMSWQSADQHILPYSGSADGLETWVDIDLGRNSWQARQLYDSISNAVRGKALLLPMLIFKGGTDYK